ncbi:hypothetical protein NLX67_03190 [Domibacillus sp. A3M-37]|uniref:hypothetical protein n=1 Tax=Domibacillus sp. A3M-37 TaxID=2962037 RepID=UPI0020B7FAEC|nr:hypothetical protein [Domibacillus sp. A3M-37]MCP3761395.1 hypothetical protein [Domibacillus sp. A3M-37]
MVDVEDVTPATVLDILEDWDSMATISLNAVLDEQFDFTLSEEEVKILNEYSDTLNYIDQKSTK